MMGMKYNFSITHAAASQILVTDGSNLKRWNTKSRPIGGCPVGSGFHRKIMISCKNNARANWGFVQVHLFLDRDKSFSQS
jgi:hypothetical protein